MMKPTEIKLTEAQLADLFQNNSKKHLASSNASDCLSATAASANRLHHVENILNDHSSAQAMKAALAMKDWSHVMAKSIANSQQSWFSFLGMNSPLKTTFATLAFAFAFAIALPVATQFSTQQATYISDSNPQQSDVINAIQFDLDADRLSRAGFDGGAKQTEQDSLFNASFG